jgi:pyridoxamine 5'-phosphate oxidase
MPTRIELWHNGEHRLHDRFRYDREGDAWRMTRLMP